MLSQIKSPFPPSTTPPALPHRNRNSAVVRFTLPPLALTRASSRIATTAASILAPAVVIASSPVQEEETTTLSNIPQTLSGECAQASDCKKARIQRPKSRKAELCTVKCVRTCIRGGGDGSPGEGPFNNRRPIVVLKARVSKSSILVRTKTCFKKCKLLIWLLHLELAAGFLINGLHPLSCCMLLNVRFLLRLD